MTLRWLTAREWLEAERLSGLPHADFAAEALIALDGGEAANDLYERLLDNIHDATGDTVEGPEQIVDTFRFRSVILEEMASAGLIEDDVTADQVKGLLRMFLPS